MTRPVLFAAHCRAMNRPLDEGAGADACSMCRLPKMFFMVLTALVAVLATSWPADVAVLATFWLVFAALPAAEVTPLATVLAPLLTVLTAELVTLAAPLTACRGRVQSEAQDCALGAALQQGPQKPRGYAGG